MSFSIGCLECSDFITCTSCEDGYYLDSSTKICIPLQSNCKFCENDIEFILEEGICLCAIYFILSEYNSECLKLVEGCEEYEIFDFNRLHIM